MRRLSLHAKAAWPGYWFLADESLFCTLFEINILSDTASKWRETRTSEFEGTVGVLTFLTYEGLPADETGEKGKPLVSGWVSVSDTMFEELWERVKTGAAISCAIWLEVLGLEIDPLGGMDSSMPDDYWDVKKQPRLKILNARLSFSYECS